MLRPPSGAGGATPGISAAGGRRSKIFHGRKKFLADMFVQWARFFFEKREKTICCVPWGARHTIYGKNFPKGRICREKMCNIKEICDGGFLDKPFFLCI